jgi:hypothetical protein
MHVQQAADDDFRQPMPFSPHAVNAYAVITTSKSLVYLNNTDLIANSALPWR